MEKSGGDSDPAATMLDLGTANEGRTWKDAKDPEWRWPTREKWFSRLEGKWKSRDTTDLERENRVRDDGIKCPFKVTTYISENEDTQDNVSIKLRSPYLIPVVRKCLAGFVEGLCCEKPKISAKDLFIAWPALRQEYEAIADRSGAPIASLSNDKDVQDVDVSNGAYHGRGEEVRNNGSCHLDGTHMEKGVEDDEGAPPHPCTWNVEDDDVCAAMHLHHLLRFLRHNFKDVSAKVSWMTEEGVVSYDMLWALLTPGVSVLWTCSISCQQCYGVVKSPGKYRDGCFDIKVEVMDFNVVGYRRCVTNCELSKFDGEVPFTSLAVCPMSFFDILERENWEERLMERGQKFYECAMRKPFRFMEFTGTMGCLDRSEDGRFRLKRVNGDGRVMVDLLSTAKVNPDWPLDNAQPPSKLLQGDEASSLHDDNNDDESQEDSAERPTREALKWAPAIVYGFSFRLKKWGCFDLDGLKDISFNDEAYEQLVMRTRNQKEMLRAILSTRLVSAVKEKKSVDVVAHKGEGCVVLCHGPPGTGKTLTAETLAETLHRPLWAISAFELGQEPGHLERNLHQVLTTALRWRAVVLLDEADCYLERRSVDVDVKHNLMTGVFLRLLEYYGGVLFLTTNRVRAFDSAILSRISLCLHYPPLNDAQRTKVWRTLLERAGATGSGPAGILSDADVQALLPCAASLNGRDIRNVVVLALSWASSRSEPLHISHVHDALQLVVAGTQELTEDLLRQH